MSRSNQLGFSTILIVLVITLVVLGGGLLLLNRTKDQPQSNTLQTEELKNQELIYEENGLIHLFDIRTSQKSLLPIEGLKEKLESEDNANFRPFWLTLSIDKTKLYFNVDQDLFIYDFTTQKTKILKDIGPNARPDEFSPDGKYALVDTGCCPGDRGRILITSEGEILDKDSGVSSAWSDDSSKYALSKGDITLSAVPTGPFPNNNSIYLKEIDGQNVATKKLLTADYQNSYNVMNWQDTQTLLVKISTFKESFPKEVTDAQLNDGAFGKYWMDIYDNPETTYLKFNISNKLTEKITEPEDTSGPPNPAISADGRWKIEIEHDSNQDGQSGGAEIPNIYISKVDGADKTKVAGGYEAIWK